MSNSFSSSTNDRQTEITINVTSQTNNSATDCPDIDMKDNNATIHQTASSSTIVFRSGTFNYMKYNAKTKKAYKGKIKILYTIKPEPDKNELRWWFDTDLNQTKVNKTWIRNARISLLKDILSDIMMKDKDTIQKMNSNEKRECFAAHLGFKMVFAKETDDAIMEMLNVVKEMQEIQDILHIMDDITIEEYYGDNIFVKILFVLHDVEIFRLFAVSIWNLLCASFISKQSFTKWDDFVIGLVYGWSNSQFWKESWQKKFCDIYNTIQDLQIKIFAHSSYKQHFKGFISSFIIRTHNIFIKESRNIIIRNMFSSQNGAKLKVTKYQSFSFGGAGINSIFKQILHGAYAAEKDTLLPYANILVYPAFDIDDIPSRLVKENRGYMRIMNAEMAPFLEYILSQFKSAMNLATRVSNQIDLKQIRESIINNTSTEDKFYIAFESILKKSNQLQSFNINLEILDIVYKMFGKAALSKASWSLLQHSSYKEIHAPLRQKQKCLALNNIQNKNKGTIKLPFGK